MGSILFVILSMRMLIIVVGDVLGGEKGRRGRGRRFRVFAFGGGHSSWLVNVLFAFGLVLREAPLVWIMIAVNKERKDNNGPDAVQCSECSVVQCSVCYDD